MAHAALPILAAFVKDGIKHYRPDLLAGNFPEPDGVKVLHVDSRRGCLPSGNGGKEEFFIVGREAAPCEQP